MPLLLVEKGPEKGRAISFAQEICMGRESENDLRIPDTAVSRRHCKIFLQAGRYYIQDMNSLNGTQVNGQFITQAIVLKENDQITIGETVLLWQDKQQQQKDPLLDTDLGGYHIIQRLGKGGMGTVYLARQISLDREVALKILDPKIAKDSNFVRRFLEEAKYCATLNHPNIVQVYDAGEYQGYFFFSMEYARGGSVQSLITGSKSLTWQDTFPLMLDTASGLEYAEKKKIVHRDIKPDNLMLTEDRRVKIVDLGLARRFDNSPAVEDSHIYGTPYYISPEQAQGLQVDFRSDIYSFGASCYRIMSGHPPFQGNSIALILQKHIREAPVPLKEIVPDCPLILSNLIAKMMQKRPEDRCSSNAEIIRTIHDCITTTEKAVINRQIPSTRRITANRITQAISRKDIKRRQQDKNIFSRPIFWILLGIILFAVSFMISWSATDHSNINIEQGRQAQSSYNQLLEKYRLEGPSLQLIQALDTMSQKYPNTLWEQEARKLALQIQVQLNEQEAQRLKSIEQQSQEQYKTAQQYEREHPNDWPNTLANYQNIVDQYPQTIAGTLAKNDAERCQRELSDTKDKLLQKFREMHEELEFNIEQENFVRANDLLVQFAKEVEGINSNLSEQVRIRQESLNKKIETFANEVQQNIQTIAPQNLQTITPQNLQQAQTHLERLRKNKALPNIAIKLAECEKYLQTLSLPRPPTPPSQQTTTLSPIYVEKLNKICLDYDFANGVKQFRQAGKSVPTQKQILDEIVQDLQTLDALLKKANTTWQKQPYRLSDDALNNLEPQLKNLQNSQIFVQKIENGKIALKIISGPAEVTQKIPTKNISNEIYQYLLLPTLEKDRDTALGLALYCYYYRLYHNAWAWTEKLAQQGMAEHSQRLKNKLETQEQNAENIYRQKIMPLYQNLQTLRNTWQATPVSDKKNELEQTLQKQIKDLQNQLQQFLQDYQYTKFAMQLKGS